MLRRILLGLLVVCLALPAAAMPLAHPVLIHEDAVAAPLDCHEAPRQKHEGHGAPIMAHDCIGCIAPLARAGVASARLLLKPVSLRPGLASALAPIRAGPETPPPRS